MVKLREHKLVNGLFEVYKVKDHPLGVRLSLERHPQMVGVAMKTLTLSMIMYKVMCCIKFKITAQ